jgi:hypothetical protein
MRVTRVPLAILTALGAAVVVLLETAGLMAYAGSWKGSWFWPLVACGATLCLALVVVVLVVRDNDKSWKSARPRPTWKMYVVSRAVLPLLATCALAGLFVAAGRPVPSFAALYVFCVICGVLGDALEWVFRAAWRKLRPKPSA